MTPLIVKGRPDFADKDFGKTLLKKFPPYVYSRLGGMLVHRVRRVEAHWYQPTRPGGANLERLTYPRLTFVTVCGLQFYAGGGGRDGRSRACVIPKADAVLCGRCAGTGPVFPRHKEPTVTRSEARARIGCVAEADPA